VAADLAAVAVVVSAAAVVVVAVVELGGAVFGTRRLVALFRG
jgi:hypothetical protein